MKFSVYFDLAIHVANGQNKKPSTESLSPKSENPREGRYFHKVDASEMKKILESADVDSDNTSEKTDAEEKLIGDEIPKAEVDTNVHPVDDSPIKGIPPEEDDPDIVDESPDNNSEEDSEEGDALEYLLNAFSSELPEEEVVEESVGRETPLIPSIMREVEAEDSENPIPLNVSTAVKKETADVKVDKTSYVDKNEQSKVRKVESMIAKFANTPMTKKMEYANSIYEYIISNNINYDLSKHRQIWKLVLRNPITNPNAKKK